MKQRLTCILLCVGLLIAAAIPSFAQSSLIAVEVKVSSDNQPVTNVVVSDGKNVFLTDENGITNFLTDRTHVFISYPSGYSFDLLPNGAVNFFRKLDLLSKENKVHFELKKNPYPEEKHSFLVIADPQLQTQEEAEIFDKESISALILAKSEVNDSNIFGVGVGDLVFDEFHLLDNYDASLQKTGIPFFQVMGNHDIDLTAKTHEYSHYPFVDRYGPPYYSFNRGEVHYVVLSDVFFLGNKQYYGYLDQQQLNWLEQDLSHVSKDKPLVVFLHIPSVSQVAKLNPGRDPNKESVINRDALYALIKDFKEVHLMSGHVHWNEKTQIAENILEHNHGAISGAWWAADICYDGSPKGFGVYRVDRNNLSWYYQPLGMDKSYQFRVYPMDKAEGKGFLVNIWNWDPQWQVNWYENNVRVGSPERLEGYDPLALETFDPSKPRLKHPWITAQKTGHLFYFESKNPAASLKVEVKDRFGNVFVQDISK